MAERGPVGPYCSPACGSPTSHYKKRETRWTEGGGQTGHSLVAKARPGDPCHVHQVQQVEHYLIYTREKDETIATNQPGHTNRLHGYVHHSGEASY